MKKYPYPPNKFPPHGAPFLTPIIPRTGPWSGDNQLGAITDFQNSAQSRQSILKMDEWGPPVLWTISFDIANLPAQVTGLVEIDITAEIAAGVGGSTQKILVDWSQGQHISVVANAIEVLALYNLVPPGLENALKLSVQLARGTRPSHTLPPVYTLLKRQTLANGDAVRVELPPLVRSLRLVPAFGSAAGTETAAAVTAVYNANLLVSTQDRTDQILSIMRGSDFTTIDSLPVNAGARFARVLNSTGASSCFNLLAEIAG